MTQYDQLIDRLIDLAIEEDIATGDVTTNSIIPAHSRAVAEMKMKADGVISGLAIAKRVYEKFEKDILWDAKVKDGDRVKKGDIILRIEASYRCLLLGERLSLNILQRMSGIATETARYVEELAGTHTQLLDTRKTAPGLRVLDKMAVKDGGATNHRMGLYDMAMIKDNHIKVARRNYQCGQCGQSPYSGRYQNRSRNDQSGRSARSPRYACRYYHAGQYE